MAQLLFTLFDTAQAQIVAQLVAQDKTKTNRTSNSFLLSHFGSFYGGTNPDALLIFKQNTTPSVSCLSLEGDNKMMSSSDPENEKKSSTQQSPPIEPLRLPTIEEVRGQDIWNNCAVRSVVSGVMGGGLGLFMGLFLGTLDNPITQDQMTGRQQFIYTAKQMGQRSWGSCKAFAIMGLVFSAAECVVEKARAKHDITNTVVAGCVTGGAISAKGGPKATCVGCAGFAAFSVLIEKIFNRDD